MDIMPSYTERHPISGRWSVFEDDGVSAWLYLTERDHPTPVADCWIYNRIPAPPETELGNYRGKPPPACIGYAGPNAQYTSTQSPDVRFVWSTSGEAVAVSIDGSILGLIVLGVHGRCSFSRNLLKKGGWGNPWDEQVYQEVFA
jgi:hypothetical protein